MQRLFALSTAIVLVAAVSGMSPANATTLRKYCAQLRSSSAPQDCEYKSLKECRASLKAKGGGHCYAMH